jgi:hypothetical protein
MSILSDFEDRVARAVEGVFAGVFRAPVQPAELARASAREMDRRRKLGVGKVYAPTMYSVLLSPADGDQLGGFADTLAGELETYLVGYAREKGYELSTRPRVHFLIDDDLKLGRFEVIGELLSAEEIAAELGPESVAEPEPAASAAPPHADVPAAAAGPVASPAPPPPTAAASGAPVAASSPAPAPSARTSATLSVPGLAEEVVLEGERVVLGRRKNCDVCLQDANASREHAVLEPEGTGWSLVDLESTNGTLVNGERVSRLRLRDGDVITVGVTEMVFHEAGSR